VLYYASTLPGHLDGKLVDYVGVEVESFEVSFACTYSLPVISYPAKLPEDELVSTDAWRALRRVPAGG